MVASNVSGHQRQASTFTQASSGGGGQTTVGDAAPLLHESAGRQGAAVRQDDHAAGAGPAGQTSDSSTMLRQAGGDSVTAGFAGAGSHSRCADHPAASCASVGCDTCLSDVDDERARAFSRYQGAPVSEPLAVYQRELSKLGVAVLFLSVSAFLNFFLLVVVHDVVPRHAALPDLTFMLIPQQPWAWIAGDVLSFMASATAVTLIVFHRARWIVLRRAFTLFGIMFGLRSLCLGTTFMPPSFHNRHEICFPQKNWTEVDLVDISRRFLSYMVTMGLTSGQNKILCGDLMFSGHTSVFTLCYCIVTHYSPPRAHLLRWVITPVCYVGMVLTVISGGHYTIDVLIAYWLATHVFYAYHHVFEARNGGMRAFGGLRPPLAKLWWYYACYWFESSVPHDGQIPNAIEWPFAYPACCVRAVARLDHWLRPQADFVPLGQSANLCGCWRPANTNDCRLESVTVVKRESYQMEDGIAPKVL